MLKLDAQVRCPDVGLTTTTRRPDFSMEELLRAEQTFWQQLRREADRRGEERPEYAAFLEWTTGHGARAGGYRRPHLHHLVKGLRPDNVEAFEAHVSELWLRATGGDAWRVDCRPLRTPVGAIAYLRQHHGKPSQAPPAGFKKRRRLRVSKGYFEDGHTRHELRALARTLATHDRIVGVVKRAIAAELFGRADDEFELDAQLTAALVTGLREMAERPIEGQLDLDGNHATPELERQELVARTVAELERMRADESARPRLVRVRERLVVDPETGHERRWAIAVLGPLEEAA